MMLRRVFTLLLLTITVACAGPAMPRGIGVPAAMAQTESPSTAIPDFTGFVNDQANVLDASTRAQMEAFLDQLMRKTGAQFAVLVVPTTAPLTPSEYKVRVFEKWGIGDDREDNGLLMLVAIEERRVEFETGYGLEGTLPDGFQSRVVRRDMAPHFRQGDWPAGITAGVLANAARIAAEKGVSLEWNGRELRYSGRAKPRPIPLAVTVLAFLVIMVGMSLASRGGHGGPVGRRRYSGWDSGWGGGFGGGLGGGNWGGGFGGGGGGFGGFGGGDSGGGGGGGGW